MIRVFEPKLTKKDLISVFRSLIKNNISGTSPPVKEFEMLASKKFDRKFAVCVSNGSVALDLALQTLDLSEGDEVIIPSHTIISVLSAVIRTNAKPVFCDVDSDSWNMTLENVKKCVTKKTKCVVMVHTYGLPSEAKQIEEFCNNNNIKLVEDSAEAHGQNYEDRLCGSFGEVSTLSFYANKHITMGEGGLVLTDSEDIYKKLLQMRNLDFTSDKRFYHENFFWNYRLSGIQASLGISQLNNLENIISQKRKQGLEYQKLLNPYSEDLQLPLDISNGSENHYWVFGIVLRKENIRDSLIEKLYSDGIETRPFFWPLHLQPALIKKSIEIMANTPISEKIGLNGLYLPLGRHINKSTQKFIVEKVISNIKHL